MYLPHISLALPTVLCWRVWSILSRTRLRTGRRQPTSWIKIMQRVHTPHRSTMSPRNVFPCNLTVTANWKHNFFVNFEWMNEELHWSRKWLGWMMNAQVQWQLHQRAESQLHLWFCLGSKRLSWSRLVKQTHTVVAKSLWTSLELKEKAIFPQP